MSKNVFEVDCDDFNNTFDKPKGHTYFLYGPNTKVSSVIRHMVNATKTGRVNPAKQHHELNA